MVIQITNQKAVRLLHKLEELHLIKVLKEDFVPARTKLSEKYKGVFSKEDATNFDKHTLIMRGEWDDLKEAAEQVRLHKQGKLKLKTAREFLNEL